MNDLVALAGVLMLWIVYKIIAIKARARLRRDREAAALEEILSFEALLREEIALWGGGDVHVSWSVGDSVLHVTFDLGSDRFTVTGTGSGKADALASILTRLSVERTLRGRRTDEAEASPVRDGTDVPDWWQVLGLGPDADLDAAERAYRKLAKAHHPDRGGDTELMGRINVARDEARSRLGG